MSSTDGLTHLDAQGRAKMVDVSDKDVSDREAVATAKVRMNADTLKMLVADETPKGDVLATARIAGIQAAKRTHELIPLCHQLAITGCKVFFEPSDQEPTLLITASVKCRDRTGVEMEALTAASIAALTIYDMLKAVDRGMSIEAVQLEKKSGGRIGEWLRGDRSAT